MMATHIPSIKQARAKHHGRISLRIQTVSFARSIMRNALIRPLPHQMHSNSLHLRSLKNVEIVVCHFPVLLNEFHLIHRSYSYSCTARSECSGFGPAGRAPCAPAGAQHAASSVFIKASCQLQALTQPCHNTPENSFRDKFPSTPSTFSKPGRPKRQHLYPGGK